jgi:hypothetical protein
MAVKTFTTEVLTSADTNTYLANSGLVYVTQASMSSSATAINNCFTSTYQNYRVVIAQTGTTSGQTVYLRLRVGGVDDFSTNYYFSHWYTTSAGASGMDSASASDAFRMGYTGTADPITETVLDISFPQQAVITLLTMMRNEFDGGSYVQRNGGCRFTTTTQFDGFDIFGSSSLTGTIYVYGYRQS